MKVSEKRALYKKQIDKEIANLDKSITALSHSYDKCRKIGETKEYGLDEQEGFEALTSRFARSSDILTQKVLKSLFILLHENIKTIIDSANLLEKLDIIDNADELLNIREVRNQIAHDYVTENINSFFLEVLNYVPLLKQIVDNVKAFYKNKILNNQSG